MAGEKIIIGKVGNGENSVLMEISKIFQREEYTLNQGLATLFSLISEVVEIEYSMQEMECRVGPCTIKVTRDKPKESGLDS